MKTTTLRFVAALPVLLSASLVGEARAEPAGVSVETATIAICFSSRTGRSSSHRRNSATQ